MTGRETSLYIDIQMADFEPVDETGFHRLRRPMKYVALNEAGLILATKTYAQATRQNSIYFINHVLGRNPMPIRAIRTDWSLVFQGEFIRHLAILNLRHERIRPYRPKSSYLF